MSILENIDVNDLDRVSGGQQVSVEGGVKTPGVSVNGKYESSMPQAKNPYNECLQIVGGQAGMIESPNNVERRQKELCGPLLQQKQ